MDVYFDFIGNMINSISEIDREGNIVSIYLGGSVARGDYAVGISDIDIYIVVENIKKQTELI